MSKSKGGALSFVVAALVAAGFAWPVSAQDMRWKLSSEQPADSLEGKGVQKFAELVKQYTNGKMSVTVYPDEQLGKAAAAFEQVQAGTTQIHNATAAYMQRWEPALKYISAPFLFDDRAHWSRFMETDLVKGWLKTVEEKAGIMVLGNYTSFPRGSFRVMVSKKPINSLADIKGLKLRMHPDKFAVDSWTHMGAEVRVMAWSEIYEGLSRGIVEAVNSPAGQVRGMRFYEPAKNIVRHDEYHQSVGFLTNLKAYNGLAPELRAALLKAHVDSSKFAQGVLDKDTYNELGLAQKGGASYSEKLDTKPFRASMAVFYEKLEKSGELPKGFLAAVNKTRM